MGQLISLPSYLFPFFFLTSAITTCPSLHHHPHPPDGHHWSCAPPASRPLLPCIHLPPSLSVLRSSSACLHRSHASTISCQTATSSSSSSSVSSSNRSSQQQHSKQTEPTRTMEAAARGGAPMTIRPPFLAIPVSFNSSWSEQA